MKAIMSIATISLLLVACASAQEDPLAQANDLYARGQYHEAVAAYRAAIANGWNGARTHYNLGNALMRTDAVGEAIAHYLVARTLAPRDGDVKANLDEALSRRQLGPPVPPATWLHAIARSAVGMATLSEWAILATILVWLAIAAIVGAVLSRHRARRLRRAAVVLSILALLAITLGCARWWTTHRTVTAVVTAESAELVAGPGADFELVQQLSEGWVLEVLDREDGWVRVSLEGGGGGWLSTEVLTMVEPDAGTAGVADSG